jgi:3-oxoadipate enol-lactonase
MPKSAADALIWIPERNAYENGKALRALYRVVPDRFRCYHIERDTVKERSSDMSNTNPVRTGFAELNGTTLYYEVAGAGHPFVLVHGHLLDRRSWDDQFAVFAGRYRVIRYDQRGFGDSGLITKGESYSDRQDLYDLLKFLGIENAYLMGVSGGGALAIDFTLEHPEMVDALIPVTAGVSGFLPTEEDKQKHPDVVRMYTSLNEAFERHDIARAVEISLALWTDGPSRLPRQAAPAVRSG